MKSGKIRKCATSYSVYDLFDSELCCGVFNSIRAVAKYVGKTEKAVYASLARKHPATPKYLVERNY